jgi:hypothetical protein
MRRSLIALMICVLGTGCVQRTLTVKTEPEGALLYLNGTEVGRTPVTRDFTWYGVYDVTLRKEGFQTLTTRGKVIAPWWQWPPIDLFAEMVPLRLRDEKHLYYTLHPLPASAAQPQRMVDEAKKLEKQLESSKRKKTRASTR